MAYTGRDWDNTDTKITKEDFKRMETGIKNNDNQINVLNETLTPVQLFSGSATSGNIVLSDNVTNYKKLLIQCGTVGTETYTSYLFHPFIITNSIPFGSSAPITYLDMSGWNSFIFNGTDLNVLVIGKTLLYPVRKIQGYK